MPPPRLGRGQTCPGLKEKKQCENSDTIVVRCATANVLTLQDDENPEACERAGLLILGRMQLLEIQFHDAELDIVGL